MFGFITGALQGLTLLGGVVSAMGGIQTGNAQKKAANYNAARDEQAAVLAIQAGKEDAKLIRLQSERSRAQSLANMAAAGVNISEGSPLLADIQAAKYAEVDAAKAEYQGELKAWGLRTDAQIERFQGEQAQKNSRWGAAGTLLQAGANFGYLTAVMKSDTTQPYSPFKAA